MFLAIEPNEWAISGMFNAINTMRRSLPLGSALPDAQVKSASASSDEQN